MIVQNVNRAKDQCSALRDCEIIKGCMIVKL
jgi:hypothetical protein